MISENLTRLRELSEQLSPAPEDIARKVVELLADGILLVNHKGQIVYASPFASDLFGYGENELVGQPIEVLIPQDKREAHTGYRNTFLASKQTRRMSDGITLIGVRKDGKRINLRIGLASIEWKSGAGAVAVVQKQ